MLRHRVKYFVTRVSIRNSWILGNRDCFATRLFGIRSAQRLLSTTTKLKKILRIIVTLMIKQRLVKAWEYSK